MGMDVYGRAPVEGGQGEYFRANVWTWGVFANASLRVSPELKEKYLWFTNDGEGPDAEEASLMARRLGEVQSLLIEEALPRMEGMGTTEECRAYLERRFPEWIAFVRDSGGFSIC